METKCISCNEDILSVALFCHNCGSQQKCKSCNTAIIKNANNCIGCGMSINKSVNSDSAMNTFEFNQTMDSRSFKAAFTDKVGSNVVEALKNMLETNHANAQLQKLNGGKPISPNNANDAEIIEEQVFEEEEKEVVQMKDNTTDFPHIDDVEKSLECSEMYWILVYAFYISEGGKNVFSQSQVYQRYKDKRDSGSRLSNFSSKWKQLVKGHLIRTIKEGELRLTDKGVKTAFDLVTNKITSKPQTITGAAKKTASSAKGKDTEKKGAKTSVKSVVVEEFDLSKGPKKPSLEDFLKEKKVEENTNHRILVIAYYIEKYCKQDSFSEGNIEYAYKVLRLSNRPLHLYQTILNAKTEHVWYDRIKESKRWKIARAGEIFVEDKMK